MHTINKDAGVLFKEKPTSTSAVDLQLGWFEFQGILLHPETGHIGKKN